MAGAIVEVDDREVIAALRRLAAMGADMQPVLCDMGEQLLNNTKQRFRDQVDPDGIKWQDYAPLDPEYKAVKKRNADKILVLDGHLSREMAYQTEGDILEIGTNTRYGATHQFGREADGIPMREFLGFSTEDKAEVLQIIERHIQDAI